MGKIIRIIQGTVIVAIVMACCLSVSAQRSLQPPKPKLQEVKNNKKTPKKEPKQASTTERNNDIDDLTIPYNNSRTDNVIRDNKKEEPIKYTAPESEKVFTSVEQMPQFPGGDGAMMRYLNENIKYPQTAMENGIQGRVIAQFVVTKTGAVGEVKIIRSVNAVLDEEAVRLCKSMPDFIPGKMNGTPVNVWYTLPITFKLQGLDNNPEKKK